MNGVSGALVSDVVAVIVLAAVLGAAEWIDPEDRDPQLRFRVPSRADTGWFLCYLAYAPATAIAVMVSVVEISDHAPARAFVAGLPALVQLGAACLVADVCAYVLHRTMHARPALWRLHRVHHGASDVRWSTTFRFHPVDGALQHAVPLVAVAALGVGPAPLSGYLAIVFVVTVFAHADVWLPGWFPMRAVATPTFHRTHHEVGRDDKNYALVLPAWDALFGTADFATGKRVSDGRARRFAQRSIAKPIASDVRLAMPLIASAASGSESRRRHTSAASR